MRLSFALASLALATLSAGCADNEASLAEKEDVDEMSQALFAVPRSGFVEPELVAVDNALARYARERCIGSIVAAISFRGFTVLSRGYGYRNGPPTLGCAASDDPFVGGSTVAANQPARIGSLSKAVLAAVVRREVKKRLAALGRSATDADVEAVSLLHDPDLQLVSSSVFTALGGNLPLPPAGDVTPPMECRTKPDPRWHRVTLGHLLSHTSGVPRVVTEPELARVRGLNTATKLSSHEALVAPAAARTALDQAEGTNTYLLGPVTLEDAMRAEGVGCFSSEPGKVYKYSNTGFGVLQYVVETLTGKRFAAAQGQPATHAGSLLDTFLEEDLGITQGATSPFGMYHSQGQAMEPTELSYRMFDGSSFYPTAKDEKRPWCRLTATSCDVSEWQSGSVRFTWDWMQTEVPLWNRIRTSGSGHGQLASEAPVYLAFLRRFWVAGRYGAVRALNPASSQGHFGSFEGNFSVASQQVGPKLGYKQIPTTASGKWDFGGTQTPGSCNLPANIDLIVSMAQNNDRGGAGGKLRGWSSSTRELYSTAVRYWQRDRPT